MPYFPTSCEQCNEITMEVIEFIPNDTWEGKCTACGCRRFATFKEEQLIPSWANGLIPKTVN